MRHSGSLTTNPLEEEEPPTEEREYVGVDLPRRRSVIHRMDAASNKLDCLRIDTDPSRFAGEISKAAIGSDVGVEATYGWYWAVDLLQDMGFVVHLAHLLRLGRLAESWIAPPADRELRELVRSGQAVQPARRAQGPGARGDGQKRHAARAQ